MRGVRCLVGAVGLAGLMGLGATAWAGTCKVAGSYSLKGTNPDGGEYRGDVTIKDSAQADCDIAWMIGKAVSTGFGNLEDGMAYFEFTLGNQEGVATYRIQSNGDLVGEWVMDAAPGVIGKEILTPKARNRAPQNPQQSR